MKKIRNKTSADTWRERAQFLEREYAILQKESAARIRDLEAKMIILMARIEELENQIKKNSSNSSKPPSSDQKENDIQKNQSLRKKSEKKTGGQPGHTGHMRPKSEHPDTIIECTPETCGACGQNFKTNPPVVLNCLGSRQEIDIPPIVPIITEFRRMEAVCSCGAKTCGNFPLHLKGEVQFGNTITALVSYLHGAHYLPYDRLSSIFSQILGISVSAGSIENLLERTYKRTKPFLPEILRIIKTGFWVGSDETGDRVNGENFWRWVWQNLLGSYFRFDKRRSYDVVSENFGEDYQGTAVHDGY